MKFVKAWRQLKAVGQAANEAAAQASAGRSRQPQGFVAGFANVLADALAPRLAATAERRGGPLPGSDDAVADGSAWAGSVAAGAAEIQARDEAFDVTLLTTFGEQVFAAIAAVWAGADAGDVRPVMSDALWEPLTAATGVRKGLGVYAKLGQQQATARVIGLHAGAWYDSAQVTMDVRLGGNGEPLPPDMPPGMAEWDEEWLFQRSVRSGGNPMIRPQECPSCGAPTEVGDHDLCLHCRAPVPYLTAGWLVTGIASHNPLYAMRNKALVDDLRANPETLQQLPPGIIRVLPEDVQAEITGIPPGSPP
jgi:hypothetical protein